MTEDHPAIAVLRQFDPSDMAASAPLFAEDAVWHYFNPNLPELQGDHVGREAIGAFFAALAEKSRGTFRIEPVSATPVGPELVVVQSRNTLTPRPQCDGRCRGGLAHRGGSSFRGLGHRSRSTNGGS